MPRLSRFSRSWPFGHCGRVGAGRSGAAALVVAVSAALVGGCTSPAAPSPGANQPGARVTQVNTGTPPGLRAQQTLDMLNSDWPIGPQSVATLATPKKVDEVVERLDSLWWDRPYTVDDVEVRASSATLHLRASYGARQDVELRVGDDGLVRQFEVTTHKPQVGSFADVDAVLAGTGARYSYQAAKVVDGRCEPVAGANTTESLPLASIFKLYVLYAVASAVKAGTVSWDDPLTITHRSKAVGSSGFQDLPAGAQVTVRTAAEKMIATSDNMATDLLIDRVGTHAVEQALVDTGHHDPASMTPFPTMYELFSVGWGEPDLREQWRTANAAGRAELLREANSRPYQPDPVRAHTPASKYGAEWYGSAEDICRVHVALQQGATGAAAPVTEILSAVAGIKLNRNDWPYIGAKAGGLPGDLTFSWYAVDSAGQPWVVSFQLNWPRDHGPLVAGWVIQIARQVFGMLPRQR
ncbi:serine hydrolase [Mycobacterium koreense]|uniref:Serine hydrolase n=1 Tax=Mycolicibacillus koreensis TaxID=1069220 RepID=A0AA91SRE1_9MYCO|nr:serine hydrolase [Mycolicibacillus koreensis]OSC33359.1 serine hydrolase [Mycolicibacillus koreensis]